jgi:subtilisin family serine protease
MSSRGPTTCGGSTGVFPELVAPGVNIRTTDLGGSYTTASGTSISAPHVAGGLALLLSAYPNLPALDQQNALINSAFDLGASGPDDVYGYGRLDLLAAYQWLAAAPPATATPLPTFTAIPSPTTTPTSMPATTLHIGDLDRSSILSGGKWNGTVTILVHNAGEQPVAGATVYGKWTNGATGNVSCITNSSGVCSITKTGLKTSVASITFTVTNVARTGLTYQSASNHDPDSDSNGTVIVVLKP